MLSREYRGVVFAVGLFLAVQVGALTLVPAFTASGYQPVENPQDPTNSLLYVVAILAMSGVMLAAFRYEFDWAVRLLIVGVSAWLSWYVFAAVATPLVAAIPATAVAVGLLVYPEWYVIDSAGVVMGAGAAGLFGISFGPLPALVLLAALAVYDAISVYGTEHMLSLAEGVMDLNIPVVLVIPLSLSYSLLEESSGVDGEINMNDQTEPTSDETGESLDPERESVDDTDEPATNERDAFFIGLGDAVIPAVLVASAATFSPAAPLSVPYLGLNLPALLAATGTLSGLLLLLRWVMRGRPHAGLPLLNGGAIGGYLLGSVLAGVSLVEAIGLAGIL
jgi:presenilin-like A22 family membrane protease